MLTKKVRRVVYIILDEFRDFKRISNSGLMVDGCLYVCKTNKYTPKALHTCPICDKIGGKDCRKEALIRLTIPRNFLNYFWEAIFDLMVLHAQEELEAHI